MNASATTGKTSYITKPIIWFSSNNCIPNYLQNVKNVEEVRHDNRGLAQEKQSQKPRGAQQASQHCACLNPVAEKKKAYIFYIGKELTLINAIIWRITKTTSSFAF